MQTESGENVLMEEEAVEINGIGTVFSRIENGIFL